jgi:hypothetical protein
MPEQLGTLDDLVAAGQRLRVWCNNPDCRHQAELDPLPLAIALGGRRRIAGIWTGLRCSRCGASGKETGAIFAMPTWPDVPMGFSRG